MAVGPTREAVQQRFNFPQPDAGHATGVTRFAVMTSVALVVSDCHFADRTVRPMSNPCTGCRLSCLVVLDSAENPSSRDEAEIWLNDRVQDIDKVTILFDREGGFGSMLMNPKIDAVYIITPPALQHVCVMKSLEARKHVLVFDAVSQPLAEFVPQLDLAVRQKRFLQSSTMFVHHHRVQTFLESVRADTFGTIESIDVVLLINEDDLALIGIDMPLEPGNGCIRRLGRFGVLMSLLLLTHTTGSRPISAQVSEYEGLSDIPTTAKGSVTFSNNCKLHFTVSYSNTTAPTRQLLEVRSAERYATMTDFVVPHPDGLATYRIYDYKREEDLRYTTLDVVRGECVDVASGPPQDVMMWRRFSRLTRLVEQQGYYESKEAISSIALSNISIQTKQVLLALEESVVTGLEVPIALQDFETMRAHQRQPRLESF
ncbi:hypothetical protein MPSEU_000722200 [Mayamaea pseudoterrestris]|nr:hypothetical protein MPSEU_000722200 [Mayamaea pseudoterrestris]